MDSEPTAEQYLNLKPKVFDIAFGIHSPNRLPRSLQEATIINIGVPDIEIENYSLEGGLILDYIPKGKTKAERIILGFTELGMWIEYTSIEQPRR